VLVLVLVGFASRTKTFSSPVSTGAGSYKFNSNYQNPGAASQGSMLQASP
jgi:hypothetical protein